MRFKGTPNMHVIDAKNNVTIGVFDSKGYLEVEDDELIKRMKRRYKSAPERQKKTQKSKSKEVK